MEKRFNKVDRKDYNTDNRNEGRGGEKRGGYSRPEGGRSFENKGESSRYSKPEGGRSYENKGESTRFSRPEAGSARISDGGRSEAANRESREGSFSAPRKHFTKPAPSKEEMIFGTRPIIEAIDAGKEIEKILIQKGASGTQHTEIMTLARTFKIPVQQVPIEKLNTLTRATHQGVVAFISAITYSTLDHIIDTCYEKGKLPFLLITDHITDVRNFGAIARTAEVAGLVGIIVPARGNAQINADAVKTSAGALHFIPVCREDNLQKTIQYLQDRGIAVVACSEKAKKTMYEFDYSQPIAIVMGSEETGISDEVIRVADEMVKIPMHGKVGSLNVSVSAAVIVYEALRQRAI